MKLFQRIERYIVRITFSDEVLEFQDFLDPTKVKNSEIKRQDSFNIEDMVDSESEQRRFEENLVKIKKVKKTKEIAAKAIQAVGFALRGPIIKLTSEVEKRQ